ncbi:interferon-induced GTP-binding protein Mx2 [Pyrenophora tritici-repentis]|nr:dynamin family protein [Pyrenophora tritici-repentis]KAG9375850.1 dynamin family protein [Pyrenophora tritici-repentis]KAI1526278.1 interferon-induced GTP-binding protein Mx2 [Pyrenophora tritici-repentis]KAI1534386.1 interferon-induced GTP-binding protein Mx2 [Pyrenophora tritici-repentis]KAI1580526.1 interferon-induced GTP-binding protein Mx2 [Pyrenophora tritici-repentis]
MVTELKGFPIAFHQVHHGESGGPLRQQIGLGQDPEGPVASRVSLLRKSQDLLGGDVDVAGQNSEDDGPAVLNVPLNHVLNKFLVLFSSDTLVNVVEDAGYVDDGKVILVWTAFLDFQHVL